MSENTTPAAGLDRRGLLRGGLQAALVGAGGLLLPWKGGGALALPDLAEAARVPVTLAPFPVSAELLELRRLKRRLVELKAVPTQHALEDHFARHESDRAAMRWFEVMYGEYWPIAQSIAERPVASWGQCVELAEIVWDRKKKWRIDNNVRKPHHHGDTDHILATLVDGVLTLGGGERFDPRMIGATHA
jgi:hypothetical protein